MWRRITNILAKSVQNPFTSAEPTVKYTFIDPKAQSKLNAHLEFRDVLKELGKGIDIQQNLKQGASKIDINTASDDGNTDLLDGDQLDDLARAYFDGDDGRQQNFNKAFALWCQSATKGSIGGTYSMAVCLREGKGTAKDSSRSFQILSSLADDKDYMLAHYAVGVMYSTGEGCVRNDERAFQHFLSAAKQGVVLACHNVANSYASGKGVAQSDKNALIYYEAGAMVGDPASKFTLSVWLNLGKGGNVDKERAFQLCTEAANAGHIGAIFNLGVYYMSGEGVAVDFNLAAEWFEKAASKGVLHGAINGSKMYFEGVGVTKDVLKAERILRAFKDTNDDCKYLYDAITKEIENK
jgi:TPR repeat protein